MLRGDQTNNLGDSTRFLPRDVLTIGGDSLFIINDLVGSRVIDPVNTLENKSPYRVAYPLRDSVETYRFRQTEENVLYVEHSKNGLALDTITFDRFTPSAGPSELLDSLLGRTYRYATETEDRIIHLEWRGLVAGELPKKGSPYLSISYVSLSPGRSKSIKQDAPGFFTRFNLDDFRMGQGVPVMSFYTVQPQFTSHRYCLEDINSEEVKLAKLETTPTEHRVKYTIAERARFPQTDEWTEGELQLLLNEGKITIDTDSDFQGNTEIEYSDESSLAPQAVSPKELKQLDFTFSNDGFYNFFVGDRELTAGRYRISKDHRYLLLGNEQSLSNPIRLFPLGPGKIAFTYPVKMRTPKPLGELLSSWYWLDVWITVEVPN